MFHSVCSLFLELVTMVGKLISFEVAWKCLIKRRFCVPAGVPLSMYLKYNQTPENSDALGFLLFIYLFILIMVKAELTSSNMLREKKNINLNRD